MSWVFVKPWVCLSYGPIVKRKTGMIKNILTLFFFFQNSPRAGCSSERDSPKPGGSSSPKNVNSSKGERLQNISTPFLSFNKQNVLIFQVFNGQRLPPSWTASRPACLDPRAGTRPTSWPRSWPPPSKSISTASRKSLWLTSRKKVTPLPSNKTRPKVIRNKSQRAAAPQSQTTTTGKPTTQRQRQQKQSIPHVH